MLQQFFVGERIFTPEFIIDEAARPTWGHDQAVQIWK
jgi:hypothetical protein